MINMVSATSTYKNTEFYLELSGETEPFLSRNYSDIFNKPDKKNGTDLRVYEYSWTPGITDTAGHGKIKLRRFGEAIKVQLLFGDRETPFRIKDIASSLKAPAQTCNDKPVSGKLLDMFKFTQSGLDALSGSIDPEDPGPLKAITAVISKLNLDSFQTGVSKWYVKYITTAYREDGFEWCISRNAFHNLGNRLTGSIAVVFISCEDKQVGYKPMQNFNIVAKAYIDTSFNGKRVCIPEDCGGNHRIRRDRGSNEEYRKLALILTPKTGGETLKGK